MIRFESVSLRRGAKVLFSDASFQLYQGEKIGIVGRNGCGKSSLFNVFIGNHQVDSGDLTWPKAWNVALMQQELSQTDISALRYVITGDTVYSALSDKLKRAEQNDDKQAISNLHAQLDDVQGWSVESKAAQLLSGLGFVTSQFDNDVQSFSGGWRVRLNLAKALMERSDLLLLDEPTNHLDIDAIQWLERWLQSYEGTLMLVSHDRDFLDATTSKTLWFEQGQLNYYSGNYEQALRQKNERLVQQQLMAEKQAAQIAHMEAFVRRFKAKASKAKQAQSRVKALEKMERVHAIQLESPFTFQLPCHEKMSDPLLTGDQLNLGYGDRVVLENVDVRLRPGDRIGVLGQNGAGKSTLLKAISSGDTCISGEISGGEHLRVGYFAQHQMQALDLDVSPLTQLQRLDATATEQSLRNFLGGFDFQDEAVADSIHHFSGGEKARLALALIAYQKPNLLVLDEPTNHLDMEVRDALLLALQQYEGAVLLVSHDRYLLRHSVDQYWLVDQGQVAEFDGDISDYHQWVASKSEANPQAAPTENNAESRKLKRQNAAALRQQLAPLKKILKVAESRFQALESKSENIEIQLADTAIYSDENKAKLTELLSSQAEVARELEDAELAWLDAMEQLEHKEKELE